MRYSAQNHLLHPLRFKEKFADYDAELIKLLFKTSRDLLFIIDFPAPNQPGKFVEVNDVACEKLGYNRDEFLNLPPIAFLSDESLGTVPYLKSKLISERSIRENVILSGKNGQKLHAELSIHLLKYRGSFIALVIGRDSSDRAELETAWKSLLAGLEENITQRTTELMQINRDLQLENMERAKAEQTLAEKELQLRLITDNMLDVIIQVDTEGRIQYISPSGHGSLGYAPSYSLGKLLFDWIHEEDLPIVTDALKSTLASGAPILTECRLQHYQGHYVWVEGVAKRILDPDGKVLGAVISYRDITNRKNMEEQLKFQAVHDPVTGLYNRTYFEMAMTRLANVWNRNIGLIMCDLDGLKYVNDTLGHDAGDQLLIAVAKLISDCFSTKYTIARIGGDEFAVILDDISQGDLEEARMKIKYAVAVYNNNGPKIPICLSIGSAITGKSLSIAGLFKEADNSMYREKLHSQQSSRSSVVHALKKALEVRDFVTEGHASRLKDLSVQLAKICGFQEYRLTDLRLFAEFHDIGKVGIPDYILFKPGPLTPEEENIMHSHCDIGHRIAISTHDLEPIAEWILKHHEWWNGSGYPHGLKGAAIPLECRILSIVDAYDAMTNDRPYRKALTHEAAIAEIVRCAGEQFDPDLVRQFVYLLQFPNAFCPSPKVYQ